MKNKKKGEKQAGCLKEKDGISKHLPGRDHIKLISTENMKISQVLLVDESYSPPVTHEKIWGNVS